MHKPNAPKPWRLPLLLLVLSLTACAATSQPPAQNCPAVPLMPAPTTQQPQTDYSTQWQQALQDFRQSVQTLQSKPTATPAIR